MLEPDQRLIPYTIATTIILLLTAIMIILQFLYDIPKEGFQILLTVYWIIILCDIVFVLSSAFLLLKDSKNLEGSEENKFKQERYWFFSIFWLIVILFFNWLIEFISFTKDKMHLLLEISILLDFTKLFTAFNLLIVFILKDDVKTLIFKKYRNLRRSESNF